MDAYEIKPIKARTKIKIMKPIEGVIERDSDVFYCTDRMSYARLPDDYKERIAVLQATDIKGGGSVRGYEIEGYGSLIWFALEDGWHLYVDCCWGAL